jgi:ATP-binding cassette subfamily F protein uup
LTRSPIINGRLLSKAFGAAPLFRNVSFTVSEGDRIGLIGPNGSGKSTLLRILGGELEPDSGEVSVRKRVHIGYAAQDARFQPGDTVRSVVERALKRRAAPEDDRAPARSVARGFGELDAGAMTLSGGWRKRLAIVEALVQAPDVVLLDGPTSHLVSRASRGSKRC